MTNLAKKIIAGVVVLLLMGTGAVVLITQNLPFGGETGDITFNLIESIKVQVEVTHGEDVHTHNKTDDWDIPDIYLSETENIVTYHFKFLNEGNTPVKISITPVSEGAGFTLTGGRVNSGDDIASYEYADSVDGVDIAESVDAEDGKVEFFYILELTDFSENTKAEVSFTVSGTSFVVEEE